MVPSKEPWYFAIHSVHKNASLKLLYALIQGFSLLTFKCMVFLFNPYTNIFEIGHRFRFQAVLVWLWHLDKNVLVKLKHYDTPSWHHPTVFHYGKNRIQTLPFDTKDFLMDSFICYQGRTFSIKGVQIFTKVLQSFSLDHNLDHSLDHRPLLMYIIICNHGFFRIYIFIASNISHQENKKIIMPMLWREIFCYSLSQLIW